MKKNRIILKTPHTQDPADLLHDMAYQAAVITLKSLMDKMTHKTPTGKKTYNLDLLDKDDKKTLLELIKIQVVPDRKIEAFLLKNLPSGTVYEP